MNIKEFQYFIEGMDIEEVPTPEQWARIKEKVRELDVQQMPICPAPVPVYPYYPSYPSYPSWPPYPIITC